MRETKGKELLSDITRCHKTFLTKLSAKSVAEHADLNWPSHSSADSPMTSPLTGRLSSSYRGAANKDGYEHVKLPQVR